MMKISLDTKVKMLQADEIWATSDWVAEVWRNLFPGKKIFVYKNPWKDLDLITKTIIDSEEDPNDSIFSDWNSWYTFGKEVMMLSNKPETERTKKELDVWNEIIDVFYKNHHWPVFNVADSAICLGAGFLIVDKMFERRRAEL